jgi:hypothetical protein
MESSSGPRPTATNLSESTRHQLNMYALAASAAGVGLLALAHPAEAKIVYTPAKIPIVPNGGLVKLDLNHDGINDFQFSSTQGCGSGRPEGELCWSILRVGPAQKSNRVRVEGWGGGRLCAAARPKGIRIGPANEFQPGYSRQIMAAFYGGFTSTKGFQNCPWTQVKQAYLGLKFVIHGTIHFGWARINVSVRPNLITGYAYETTPNKPITTGKTTGADDQANEDFGPGASLTSPTPDTPQPATLGMLALGASGVPLWRRKESIAQCS